MGNLNENTRGKKFFKSGDSNTDRAFKNNDGEIVVPPSTATELSGMEDISNLINDNALFQVGKYVLKPLEDLRLDIEEIHAFLTASFGRDSSTAGFDGKWSSLTEVPSTFPPSSHNHDSTYLKLSGGTITGDLNVTGTVTAQEFHTEFVSSSIIYESGSTKFGDTSDDNHDFTGSLNLNGDAYFSGSVGIGTNNPSTTLHVSAPKSSGDLLFLHNSQNASGTSIMFSDQQNGGQLGRITYRHSDSQSQGGGASFHFTAEPDTVLIAGNSTNKGRFVSYSQNSTSEVDYGFGGNVNTGMYSPGANQVGLVTGGSRKLLVNGNGVTIQNGRLYLGGTVDTNTSSTTALVLNGTEVEKRTLGSAAFTNTGNYVAVTGDTMTGDLDVNADIKANTFTQEASGIPRNNLGSPTVTEMALFDPQFTPKTTLANDYNDLSDLTFWIQSTSSSSWTEVTTYSDDQKRKFLRTANSSVIIPNNTYKFRVEFRARSYTFANALYGYWSSNSHQTKVHIYKYNVLNSTWTQHTNSSTNISSWPGHMYLPFSTIAWHENATTSTGHYRDIRIEFTPTWMPYSGTGTDYSANNINIYGLEIWGGYPSGRRTPHYYDQNGKLSTWGDLYVNGNITLTGTIDGRDVATDGAKLDNIAANANNYSLPLGTSTTRGGFKIGYSENGKNYPVEISNEKMYVNVPWTDNNTTYSTATSSTLGLVKIGYTENGKNYPVELSNGQMYVNVPWTDTDTNTQLTTAQVRSKISGTGLISYNSSTGVISTTANNYSLPAGTSTTRGGFKIGYSENGKNYPVEVSNEKMYVNVPWTDTDTNTQLSTEQVQDIVGGMVSSNTETNISVTYDDTNGKLNFVSTNTWRGIHDSPVDGATTTSISSNWAFDNVKTAVPTNAVFTDTTYTVGDGGLTQKNFTTTLKNKLDNIAANANNYTHPTHPGDDISIDTGALTGATVISDLDFNVTTDTLGHVTDANATISTRNLTAADIGAAASSHNHDSRYYTETESDAKYIIGSTQNQSHYIHLNQNPVGTTYGDTVSTVPSYYLGQKVGDNDGWRLYGEAPSSNDVKMVFEVIDDIEAGDTWIFRNKKTYSPYTANDVVIIEGNGNITTDGEITLDGRLRIGTVDTNTSSTSALVLNDGDEVEKRTLGTAAFSSTSDFAPSSHNQAWSTITGTPTTLAGYGITDALSSTTPNAPTNLSLSIVNNTVNVTFDASTTSNIDLYLIFSSANGGDYSLVSVIPPDDFSSTMSIIDDSFDDSGTQAYRVYAQKNGIISSALSGNITYTVPANVEPTNMSVVNLNSAFYIQWDPPSSNARFVTAYNVYKHEHSTQSSLSRSSATLVYSGMNTSYMYQITGNNNTNFHQFWVETTTT